MTQIAKDYFIQEFLSRTNGSLSPEMLSVVYGNFTDISLLAQFDSQYRNIVYELQNTVADARFDNNLKQAFGFPLEQFLIDGKFGSPMPTYDLFEYLTWYFDPIIGNCFKFNSGVSANGTSLPILEQEQPGVFHGIYFTAFVDVYPNQSYNFMNLLNSYTFGLQIAIGNQTYVPLNLNQMIPLRTGTCTYLGLKKTVSRTLAQPFSPCVRLASYRSILFDKFIEYNKTYQQAVCFELCKQKQVIDACACAIIDYPNIDSVSTCTSQDQFDCVGSLSITYEGCNHWCPQECLTIAYDYTTDSVSFPDALFAEVIKANPAVQARFADVGYPLGDVSYSDLANSLACFYIYFTDMKYTNIEESETMTVVDLFAYIGGFAL
jgi:hypothetical protein